jgi:hypothetical protein
VVYFVLLLLLYVFSTNAEEIHPDTKSRLPFHLDESRRIDAEELKSKREGSFITGLPSISSDPVTGIWYGGSGYYIENGKKTNPLFAYSPYVYRVSVDFYQSSVGAKYYGAGIDLPFFRDTPYRINLYGFYDRNLRGQYFGVGESTLKPLSYHPRNDPSQPLVTNAEFDKREEALSYRRPGRTARGSDYVTDQRYNEYDAENSGFTLNVDRTFWGAFRFALGADVSRMIVRAYDGKIMKAKDPYLGETDFSFINVILPTPNAKTKLTEDKDAEKINGYTGGYTNYLKSGIAYDSRDFEPNPRKGIFAEINFIKSSRAWGSDFDFQRGLIHGKFFYLVLPKVFSEFILAGRVALTRVTGTIPFYEYRHIWSIDTPIYGLGGGTTLQGYKQDRFVGNAMGFGNIEARYRFASLRLGDEYFTFQIGPSFALGRVWDSIYSINTQGYKYSRGILFRIICNQSTVISLDYAVSREDKQFFMNLNHSF